MFLYETYNKGHTFVCYISYSDLSETMKCFIAISFQLHCRIFQ